MDVFWERSEFGKEKKNIYLLIEVTYLSTMNEVLTLVYNQTLS